MLFADILGQEHIKSHLTTSADNGRIPHAQLFVGPEGSGTLPMAIAYAQYILCKNSLGENTGGNDACNLKFKNLAHPDIVKALALKSYEGGYKVMLIWMAEKMNVASANKLLKLIEEPPNKTIFILVAEDEEQIINTIRSRCQVLHFPPLAETVIQKALVKHYDLDTTIATKIAHQANGNYNKACDLVYQDSEDLQFEEWFVFF